MHIIKLFLFSLTFATLFQSVAAAKTYYVDATTGNDANHGTSSDLAWQTLEKLNEATFSPGDRILFKADERWTGSFAPNGSGRDGAPIVVDRYGDGDLPILDGAGTVDHVIRLEDVDYWELNNLEITNDSKDQGNRIGVYIVATDGKRRHFHLRNLFIHHIMGKYTFEMPGKNTGGIGIIGNGDARFDDILIENCTIGDLVRVGIFTNGNEGRPGKRPITNLIIRSNTIYRCAGDGAIIRYADKPLIEHNEAYENHNGPQDRVKHGVALWCRSTDGAVFQYNHVYKTYGDMDGQAFDADLEARDTVVQYNYSHDNEGGFMLVYGSSSDAIVRFNISRNDGIKGGHIFDFPIWTEPRGSGVFHNNTIYLPSGNNAVIADEAKETALFYNNIFYNEGGGALLTLDKHNKPHFDHNCFYGYNESDVDLDEHAIDANPQFIAATGDTNGIPGPSAFKLSSESPCINAGVKKFAEGDRYRRVEQGATDYFGNPLGSDAIDIGAHLYSAESNAGSGPKH